MACGGFRRCRMHLKDSTLLTSSGYADTIADAEIHSVVGSSRSGMSNK